MPQLRANPAAPSDDKRWRVVEATMRRSGYAPHGLIETLHSVQDSFGFLEDAAMRYVAARLRVPLSKVFGVATFYHLFSLKPQGRHVCIVCMGTACYIKGAPRLLKTVETAYGIKAGETTTDGEMSLGIARCIGSCGVAPVAVVDGDVVPQLTAETLTARLGEIKSS
jgi:bidirectional [NiFe] hydrogenase diaphorase subunit